LLSLEQIHSGQLYKNKEKLLVINRKFNIFILNMSTLNCRNFGWKKCYKIESRGIKLYIGYVGLGELRLHMLFTVLITLIT